MKAWTPGGAGHSVHVYIGVFVGRWFGRGREISKAWLLQLHSRAFWSDGSIGT